MRCCVLGMVCDELGSDLVIDQWRKLSNLNLSPNLLGTTHVCSSCSHCALHGIIRTCTQGHSQAGHSGSTHAHCLPHHQQNS